MVRDAVAAAAPGLAARGRIIARGDSAFLAPTSLPPALEGVALAPGLQIAERRGRTWRPAHALAMALRPARVHITAPVDDAAAVRFFSGQPITGEGSGSVLVTWHGYPLGWARARGGTLTPLLPKGLRVQGGTATSLL